MGRLIDETNLMNLLCALDDARHDLCYAIKKIPELPTVEAIPKDQYEARLKADLVAILDEFDLRLYEKYEDTNLIKVKYVRHEIHQKIDKLKEKEN